MLAVQWLTTNLLISQPTLLPCLWIKTWYTGCSPPNWAQKRKENYRLLLSNWQSFAGLFWKLLHKNLTLRSTFSPVHTILNWCSNKKMRTSRCHVWSPEGIHLYFGSQNANTTFSVCSFLIHQQFLSRWTAIEEIWESGVCKKWNHRTADLFYPP